MVRLRRRHDALGAREGHAGCEALGLVVGTRLDQPELLQVRDQRRHAVITQTAGVEARRREGRSERVHLGERRHVRGVAEVVGVLAARERRAGRRLDRDDARTAPAAQRVADERKRDAREVRAAAGTADHHVGPGAGHLHLLHRLQADDGLVQQHVVQHRAERVLGVLALHRDLDGLGDRDAERSGVVRCALEHTAAVGGLGRRRRQAARAEGLHERAPVRLLVVRDAHLKHQHLEAEQVAREGQRRAPLARTGLGRQALDARLLVVERLRDGGVRLVRARRAHALVLVEDLRGRTQDLLQPVRAIQRRGTPEPVDLAHRLGDLHLALGGDLLHDQFHREQRREVVGPHRLQGAGVQHRGQRLGQVGLDVVPALRDAVLGQQVFGRFGHRRLLVGRVLSRAFRR